MTILYLSCALEDSSSNPILAPSPCRPEGPSSESSSLGRLRYLLRGCQTLPSHMSDLASCSSHQASCSLRMFACLSMVGIETDCCNAQVVRSVRWKGGMRGDVVLLYLK